MAHHANAHGGVICAILAGGQSRRMGRPKGLIDFGGRLLIERLIDEARLVTEWVYICSNAAPAYEFLDLPIIPDIFEGQGPLAGLHAAMTECPEQSILLLACDLPNVHARMMKRLIYLSQGYDATAPCASNGDAQPLCGVYRPSCRPVLESCLQKGNNRALVFISDPLLRVRMVGPKEGNFTDQDLLNLNFPEDLAKTHHPSDNHI